MYLPWRRMRVAARCADTVSRAPRPSASNPFRSASLARRVSAGPRTATSVQCRRDSAVKYLSRWVRRTGAVAGSRPDETRELVPQNRDWRGRRAGHREVEVRSRSTRRSSCTDSRACRGSLPYWWLLAA